MSRKTKRPNIPPLCGVTEVADILGIKRTTMPSMRLLKGFPEPITLIGNRPIWLESDIVCYKEKREKNKKSKGECLV
jgi:predicted DNA-binding transcriptional regulator AlpA